MASTFEALDSLRVMLDQRRRQFLEKMGGGLENDNYRVHVGRCKELDHLIETINEQLKSLGGGEL